ncbi:uncharacterized protein LOC143449762 [Clavelina lepadiformis]|uniref:Uncharacterized protein n=1 Tax=Clavelina lepadiformis TaxID=159417 RepID=A0ABP0H1V2_CLALP
MGDNLPNQSQTRAHKKNVGAVQALGKVLEQLQKDKKKRMQMIDQETIDSHKFLEQVLSNSGNSVTYEEVFPSEKERPKGNTESSPDKHRPTKSSVLRMEVQLRKSLAEARYKTRREEFFRRWKDVFERDLALDDWFVEQKSDAVDDDWRFS